MKIELDQGYQFGLGAFETIALEHGRPVFLEKHLNRLEKASRFLKLGSLESHGITCESVWNYLYEISEEEKQHGALKVMLSEQNVVFQIRVNHYEEEQYRQGFVMDFSKIRRNETSPLVGYKTMNYGDCILEKRAAAEAGMDERIFLNTCGEISEGTVSNIFFVRGGKLETPAMGCGLLPGIMREYLCKTEEVEETVIYQEMLNHYEECFVTNSLMGIMPVKQLGDSTFTQFDRTLDLRKKYLKMIQNL